MARSIRPATLSMSANDNEPKDGAWGTDASVDDYDFLVGRVIDRATLEAARELAGDWDVDIADVLIANGWVTPSAYARALADVCEVDFVEPDQTVMLAPIDEAAGVQANLAGDLLRHSHFGFYRTALAQPSLPAGKLRQRLREIGDARYRLAFTTRVELLRTIRGYFSHQLIDQAANGLGRRFQGESATTLANDWYGKVLLAFSLLLVAGLILAPLPTISVTAHIVALMLLSVVVFPIPAIRAILDRDIRQGVRPNYRLHDSILPVYTVLVPILREDQLVKDLALALKRIDYPPAKLDIKLVLEGGDHETIAAVKALDLPGNVDVITVPDASPRSKAKALNYALNFALGDYVVVYDADDRPDPGQLRLALLAFQDGPANQACVQARLTAYNGDRNWLTRQFAGEVSAHYSGLLPMLRLKELPVPLGESSCHFRVSMLRWLGGWDAFSVTEGADLGLRLARRGYFCGMLDSVTGRQAPDTLRSWLVQRTRRIKGWMQTWLVHMRQPKTTRRELGDKALLGMQHVFLGQTLAGLALPVLLLLAAGEFLAGGTLAASGPILGTSFWVLSGAILVVAYLVSMTLGFLCLQGKASRLFALPFYWLLTSLATYRALSQLISDPQLREKADHAADAPPNPFDPRA